MAAVCVYPGSFDPITVGHLDIIQRAAKLYDTVIVAVLHNPGKQGCFSVEQRMDMIRTACQGLPVQVTCFDGLLMAFMRETGTNVVLRGLRAVSDFEMEFQMAQLNHQLAPEVETLFMMTTPQNAYISSSLVREIGAFGGDISAFIPASIEETVRIHLLNNDCQK